MSKTFSFFLFVFVSLLSFSQQEFPDSWVGNYEGDLQIFGMNDVRMVVSMKLEMQPKTDSLYTWHLIYEMNGNVDKRLYELKVIDKAKGHYVIDEKNSILIDGYYHLNRFTSMFEVMDSYIVTTYTKEDEALIFEIVAGSMKNPGISGNQTGEGNEIPEVKSYSVNGRQKAVLYKVN